LGPLQIRGAAVDTGGDLVDETVACLRAARLQNERAGMQTSAAPTRTLWQPLALVLAALMLLVAATADSAFGQRQVHRFDPAQGTLAIKKDGKVKERDVANGLIVRLEKRNGKTRKANKNELVPGADIEDMEVDDGEIEEIDVEQQPSGSSDCSFDTSDQNENMDKSFDCSEDYADESQDCSFDQSGDKEPGDLSKDTSWDCSYEDEDEGLSWDCSYDSSQGSSWDASGGDADGDFSFDCSWESQSDLAGPLFSCAFGAEGISFLCTSEQLGQEFGASLDVGPGIALDPTVDFNEDVVDEDGDADDSDCSGGGGSFDCSFSGDREFGDCEADFSYDESHSAGYRSGDLSGDASVSCSYESGDPDDA